MCTRPPPPTCISPSAPFITPFLFFIFLRSMSAPWALCIGSRSAATCEFASSATNAAGRSTRRRWSPCRGAASLSATWCKFPPMRRRSAKHRAPGVRRCRRQGRSFYWLSSGRERKSVGRLSQFKAVWHFFFGRNADCLLWLQTPRVCLSQSAALQRSSSCRKVLEFPFVLATTAECWHETWRVTHTFDAVFDGNSTRLLGSGDYVVKQRESRVIFEMSCATLWSL